MRQLRSILLWNKLVNQAIFMVVTEMSLNIGRHPLIIVIFFIGGVHVDLNCSFLFTNLTCI